MAIVVGVNDAAHSRDAMALGALLADTFGDELRPVHVTGCSPAMRLYQISARGGVHAIVIGSSHRGRIGTVVHGGVGQQLLSRTTCPVVVAPTGYADRPAKRLRTVVCGFDGSDESYGAWEVACQIAGTASATARLIAVYESPVCASSAMTGYLAPTDDELRKPLDEALRSAVAQAPDHVLVEARLLDGHAVHELRAASQNADLLVLGSRGGGPLNALILRGVTSRLMVSAACPVIAVPRKNRAAGRHQQAA